MIGKKVWATAKLGTYDHKLDKICLENVHTVEGFERDHMWVKYDNKRMNYPKGTEITFTAFLCEYTGLDGDKQVKKIGLQNIKNVGVADES